MKHGHARALQLRSIDEATRTATFVASTGALDSYDEQLDQTTWRLERYRANPVVLYAHNDRDLPIGRTESIDLNAEGNLEFSMRFASSEANPKAEQVFALAREGMLNGASVGFRADKAERMTDANGRTTRRLTGLELFEISIVPVPSNPETLAKMRARAVALANGEPLMTPEQIAQMAKALGLPTDATAEDVFNAFVAKMAEEGTEDPATEPGAAAAEPDAALAKAALLRETGAETVNAAVTQLAAFKRSHLEQQAERERLAAERAKLEGVERRSLVGELVKLGRETPATAWAKGEGDVPDGKTPKGALATMPIEELRERVKAFRATAPAPRGAAAPRPAPPVVDSELGLTEREIEQCKAKNIDPKKYAARKAALTGRPASSGV